MGLTHVVESYARGLKLSDDRFLWGYERLIRLREIYAVQRAKLTIGVILRTHGFEATKSYCGANEANSAVAIHEMVESISRIIQNNLSGQHSIYREELSQLSVSDLEYPTSIMDSPILLRLNPRNLMDILGHCF